MTKPRWEQVADLMKQIGALTTELAELAREDRWSEEKCLEHVREVFEDHLTPRSSWEYNELLIELEQTMTKRDQEAEKMENELVLRTVPLSDWEKLSASAKNLVDMLRPQLGAELIDDPIELYELRRALDEVEDANGGVFDVSDMELAIQKRRPDLDPKSGDEDP